MEHRRLARQLRRVVLLGEGDVHVHLLADAVADQLVLEAGDERAAAQHQRLPIGAATLEVALCGFAGIVQNHLVARLCGAARDGHVFHLALQNGIDLAIHLCVGNKNALAYGLQALVIQHLIDTSVLL